tara:strand:+ start:3178 stop:3396 length:219 start_codon:yes stop_codon:yes gene_type:complete
MIRINDREDIIRDENSKAILKTDLAEKKAWLLRKDRNNKIFHNENEINNMKDEISEIKKMVSDIKDILRTNN